MALVACNPAREDVTPAPPSAQEAHSEPTPETALARLDACTTLDEALPLLTGMMTPMYASVPPEKKALVLASLQMKGAQLRTIPISDAVQFVLASMPPPDKHESAFMFEKVGGEWKIANKLSPHSIVPGLYSATLSPEQFNAAGTLQLDDQTYVVKSAFATYEKEPGKRLIAVDYYPFPLQRRDLEYLKIGGGEIVQETGTAATAVASSIRYPKFDIHIAIKDDGKLVSICHSGGMFPDQRGSFSQCTQSSEGMTKLNAAPDRIEVAGKGELQLMGPGPFHTFRWQVELNVPLLAKGLE
jgi:hypothetical protein